MKKHFTLILGLTLSSIALAQMPHLSQLKDINPDGSSSGGTRNFTVCNGKLYFTADDGTHGGELWVTDSTAAGTYMVKDIHPGSVGSYPNYIVALNDKIYFQAYDGTHGMELWVSDGTEAGTTLLKDIQAGSNDSYPASLKVLNSRIFFSADDGIHAIEPWVTDGTVAGTHILYDINQDPDYQNSNPDRFTVYNDKMYFVAEDQIHGMEPWVSDGTTAGTMLLKDINTNSPTWGSDPLSFTVFNGELYFKADLGDGLHDVQLWKTDGTEAGTVVVKSIYPAGASNIDHLHVLNNSLFFTATDGVNGYELWKSDGTDAGTALFKDINPGSGGSYGDLFTDFGGKFYFQADDGTHGYELWVCDGTAAGTMLFKDINAGSGDGWPSYLTVFGSKMYFEGEGPDLDQLWMTDGTAAGTVAVVPPAANTDALGCNNGFAAYKSSLYLNADYFTYDCEVWRMDTLVAPLGIHDITSFNTVNVYPNPSKGLFNVELAAGGDARIEVYNVTGRHLFSQSSADKTVSLDLTGYANGVYTLCILQGDQLTDQLRIIKND